ncbi:ABC-2 transporter permease [Pseudomonas sp. B22129]|uniref:ABC-2 transporter permease n=1 Tax=Pseudomonas sp. B22129 TaxID=3235111 RepID=UPI003783918B
MKRLPIIFKRQLASYACAPGTYVSVAVFLFLCTALGLYTNQWMERSNSDMHIFFELHPWLYLLLIPTLSTHLWSDEQNTSLRDLMKTLPITAAEIVIGKFLAAWTVCGIALTLMFPVVIVANYLGTADNIVIASQYFGSWLLAGSYVSVGCFISVVTRQRVAIFLLTSGLLLTISGLASILDALDHQAPIWIIDSLISLNPLSRFGSIDNGKLTLRDSLYFTSMILAFLSATIVTLNHKSS